MMRPRAVRGMTLLEVVITVSIIGLMAGVTTLALPRLAVIPPNDPGRVLTEARRRALRDGRPQPMRLLIDSVAHEAVAMPDGSVIADSGVAIDRFTARWRHAR